MPSSRWPLPQLQAILRSAQLGRTEVQVEDLFAARSLRETLYRLRRQLGCSPVEITYSETMLVLQPKEPRQCQ